MMTRRKFLTLGALAFPAAVGADAAWVEPTNLCVKELTLTPGGSVRFVQFTRFPLQGRRALRGGSHRHN